MICYNLGEQVERKWESVYSVFIQFYSADTGRLGLFTSMFDLFWKQFSDVPEIHINITTI